MNGWCLLMVCLGAALVQVDGKLDPYIIEKAVAFFRLVDRNGDGKLVFDDYHLISQNVLTIPGYDKYNASYLFDVVTVNSWTAFPNKELNLAEFLAAVEATPPDAMKTAVYGLAKSMFGFWDYLSPFNCLTHEEIKWKLINLGKYNDVDEQAKEAIEAMHKRSFFFSACATLSEYQETAYNYFIVTDLTHDSKYFFGYLEGR